MFVFLSWNSTFAVVFSLVSMATKSATWNVTVKFCVYFFPKSLRETYILDNKNFLGIGIECNQKYLIKQIGLNFATKQIRQSFVVRNSSGKKVAH